MGSTRRARPAAGQLGSARRGIGRSSSPAAERVSDDLRLGTGGFLRQRRRLAVLALGAIAAYGVVGLYQFGLIRHVPEPALPLLDADRVDASGEAYAVGSTPDAALGIASAGLTLVLAGMGGRQRHAEHPWIPLALAGKVAAEAAGSLLLFAEQLTRHRRVCSWCTLAAALNLAAVPAAFPEALAALRSWAGNPHTGG
jgi:uncharacterized membrane protein